MYFTKLVAIVAIVVPAVFAAPTPGTKIPNQYIIQYHPSVSDVEIQSHETWLSASAAGAAPAELQRRGLNISALPILPAFKEFGYLHKYQGSGSNFRGYAAKLTSSMAALLAKVPQIALVEQDTYVSLSATQNNPAAWGLKRISKASLPLPTTYTYPDTAGAGVKVYVIDTGIQINHPDFGGRALWGGNFVGDGSNTDGNGHGTHVAGTIAGTTYGVAKKATVYAVKVLGADGSGTNSGVIAGVNYVAQQGASGKVNAIANMSLGGTASTALDNAVAAAIANGISFAIAAGNSAVDACNTSPARVAAALTVGASDSSDRIATFSNYGSCVDVIAPGVSIISTWIGSTTNTISGTSMASPHVAGVLALLLGTKSYTTPAAIQADLLALTAANKITSLPAGTPNRLLQVPPVSAVPTSTPVPTPTPTPTPSATPVACAHSYCVTGVALTCNDPCVTRIVAVDPYCGRTRWDATCVRQVGTVCGITC
ncbi:subtilisin-like serine protease [Phlyctochytrium bullatum]|nr:subtilisin-like serine protease [Phlyctochytrium bullatum]